MPKYFWLKLDRNFFKRHDIRIIEDMPNGKDYILFYLKLLVESIDHEGRLRFSDTIPYDEKMLSTVANTNIDVVRSATKIFTELGMMESMDDKTIYMKETLKMLGEGSSTDRVQRFREKQKMIAQGNVTETLHETEIELELDLELDTKKTVSNDTSKESDRCEGGNSNNSTETDPKKEAKHKCGEYKHVLLTDREHERLHQDYDDADVLIKFFDEYMQRRSYTAKDHNLCLRGWVRDAVDEKNPKPKGKIAPKGKYDDVD